MGTEVGKEPLRKVPMKERRHSESQGLREESTGAGDTEHLGSKKEG